MNWNYEHLLHRLLALPLDGPHWEYSLLHQLSQGRRSETAARRDLPRAHHCSHCHRPLQFYRRWLDEILAYKERHNPNCRRRHPLHPLLKNDLSAIAQPKRGIAARLRALYRAARDSLSRRSCRFGRSHDLHSPREQQLDHGRRHPNGMACISHHPPRIFFPEKNPRLARDHGHGTIDGPDPNPHLCADVSGRSQRLLGTRAFALTISYLGTHYFGWQKTESGPSIQGELEKALKRILQEEVICEAASRTDRGVHAAGQVVQFTTTKDFPGAHALNGVLPKDIRVLEAKEVSLSFHPTLAAHSKTYHYNLDLGPVQDPFRRHISWHFPYFKGFADPQELLGTRDFSTFTTEPAKNPICTLYEITCSPEQIIISGDRFLYKMVRRLVGHLVGRPGLTAPAHGLTLYKVHYKLNSYD